MSYLLETLKRLEQKRNRQGTSDLLLIQGPVRRERKKRAAWPYVLSAALLVNAAVALWWMAPWRAGQPPSSPSAQPGHEVSSLSPEPSRQATAKVDDGAVPAPSSVKRDAARPSSPAAEARPAAPAQLPAIKRSEQASRPQPSPALQGQIEKRPALSTKVFDVQDLPPAVQAGIPQMKISLHSYESDRNSRLVRINEKTLREGESLTPEIRVEEITRAGAILSSQGYLFRLVLDHTR